MTNNYAELAKQVLAALEKIIFNCILRNEEQSFSSQVAKDILSKAKALQEYFAYNKGWQDISTAPMDGRPILAKSAAYTLPFVVYWGNWAEEQGLLPALPDSSTIEKVWLLSNCEEPLNDMLYAPTHWMPLLELPSEGL